MSNPIQNQLPFERDRELARRPSERWTILRNWHHEPDSDSKKLCPTDLTEDSQPILAMGCERAKQSGAELHLLHVVDGLMNPTPYLGPPLDEGSTWEEAIQQRAQAALDGLALPPEFQEIPVVRVLRIGSCATSIIEYVSQARIDLIVLGTHGRTGLGYFLLGSLAENIASRVPCAVLTVPPLAEAQTVA